LDTAKSEAPVAANTLKERRFHCDGKVEVNRIPSNGKREGKLIDLSKSGCSIEMAQPFAAPSYVEIMIDTSATRLRLTGTVKNSQKTGMSIEFAQVGTGAKRLLDDLLAELQQSEDKPAV
jgi:hypothetical protein